MRQDRHLHAGLAVVVGLLLLAPCDLAWGQACITCRTEKCPNKTSLQEWCGTGKDPSKKARPKADKPEKETPEPVIPSNPPVLAPMGEVTPPPGMRVKEMDLRNPAFANIRTIPAPPSRTLPILKWSFLGATVAGGVMTGVLFALNGRPTCDLPDGDTQCPKILWTQPGAIAAATATGAFAATAVVLFVLDGRKKR